MANAFITNDLASRFLKLRDAESQEGAVFLETMITGALDWISQHCDVLFGESRITEEQSGGGLSLIPRWRPLRQVVSVTDLEGEVTYTADTDYELRRGGLVLIGGDRWPEGRGRWRIVYDAGYVPNELIASTTTAADNVSSYPMPLALVMAGLHLIRREYDNRGGVQSESVQGWSANWDALNDGQVTALLQPYRRAGL